MEYLGLGDLGTYMEEQPPIAEEECRAIILQISQGANYLHDNGVAHRDMKPSVSSASSYQQHVQQERLTFSTEHPLEITATTSMVGEDWRFWY